MICEGWLPHVLYCCDGCDVFLWSGYHFSIEEWGCNPLKTNPFADFDVFEILQLLYYKAVDLFAIFARSKGPGYSTSSLYFPETWQLHLCIYCQRLRAIRDHRLPKTSLTYHKSTYPRARKSATSLSRMWTRSWSRAAKCVTYSLLICCDCMVTSPKIFANSRF